MPIRVGSLSIRSFYMPASAPEGAKPSYRDPGEPTDRQPQTLGHRPRRTASSSSLASGEEPLGAAELLQRGAGLSAPDGGTTRVRMRRHRSETQAAESVARVGWQAQAVTAVMAPGGVSWAADSHVRYHLAPGCGRRVRERALPPIF